MGKDEDYMKKFTPTSRIDDFLKKPIKKKTLEELTMTDSQKQEFFKKKLTEEPRFTSKL